jgi:FkbM family methyltransferase
MELKHMSLQWYLNSARFTLAKKRSGDKAYDIGTYRTLAGMRKWKADDLIFDVGANDGRTILRWRRHLPATRIYAFEPVESTFATLTERTASLSHVKLFKLALGASPERRNIYLHERGSAMNSFYADRTNTDATEEVQVDTLDAILDREKVGRIQLLKIDAEGHDLEVLKGATNALRDARFEFIQVEAGFDIPGKTDANLWDFNALLRPFGYYLYAITNQCRTTIPTSAKDLGRVRGMLSYCDAIFVCDR